MHTQGTGTDLEHHAWHFQGPFFERQRLDSGFGFCSASLEEIYRRTRMDL